MQHSINPLESASILPDAGNDHVQDGGRAGAAAVAVDGDPIFHSVDKHGHTIYYIPLNWAFAGGTSQATPANPEPEDTASIHIEVRIDRPLEENEQKDLDDLKNAILRVTRGLGEMPDDHTLTMDDGRSVNGRELKQLWSKTDFVINDKGHLYENGFTTGEANRNHGDPIVSFNIDIIESYKRQGAGGENHLVLHELSHMTEAGESLYAELSRSGGKYTEDELNQNERYANDIARAIAHHCGIPTLSEEKAENVKGYSPGGVKRFVDPAQRRKEVAAAFREQSAEDATRTYPELKRASQAFEAVEAVAGRTRMDPQERGQLLSAFKQRLARKIEHGIPIPSPRDAVSDASRMLASAREKRGHER